MLFVRIAEDDPAAGEARARLLDAHATYLRRTDLPVRIVGSGPLFETAESGGKHGALIVVEAGSLDDVERFNAGDPFVRGSVYSRIQILRWNRTIG